MRVFGRLALVAIAILAWIGIARAAEPAKQPGMLGAEIADVTKEDVAALKMDEPTGVKIVKAQPGSAAEAAGLQAGDVVISVDGQELTGIKPFIAAVSGKGAGAVVKLKVLRDGAVRTLTATLAARPAEPVAVAVPERSPLFPQLDTGGHQAIIKGLTFTPDGTRIISAGNDKVIRIWDPALGGPGQAGRAGKTVRTIRGEAGAGNEGKIYALALSPDGRTLAVGGWMHPECAGRCGDIRLYDVASGALTGLLKGHTNVVLGLAFSPDPRDTPEGKRHLLISGSGDNTAIIWDVTQRVALHTLTGHTDAIYAVGFTPDGARAVTGSDDTTLRLWRIGDGSFIAEMKGHADKVRSLAISPRAGSIASGDYGGEIRLWDGATGASLRVLANQGTEVGALRFRPDGTQILSTCGQGHPCNDHVWDLLTSKEVASHKIDDNIVVAGAISPDGRYAATGGGNNQEIHVWELATGKRVPGPDGQPLNLAGTGRPGWAVGVSADGTRIGWGHVAMTAINQATALEFQLRLPRADGDHLGQPIPLSPQEANWRRARAALGRVSLTHRKGGNYGSDAVLDITRDGAVIASIERGVTDGYQHRSYTFTPDGQSLISGGDGGDLTAYDVAAVKVAAARIPNRVLKGNDLEPLAKPFIGHEGDVLAVATSPDGRFIVSGSADQTIRLWNLATRELIATLFHGRDGQWVMYTPQGYFTSSPGGDSLIGWQINKGADKAADYVTAAQLRTQFYRPDIIDKAIILASASEAVAKSEGTQFKLDDLLARPVPSLRIASPADGATMRSGTVDVKVTFAPTPDPIKSYTLRVNGTQVATQALTDEDRAAGTMTLIVPLAKGANTVVVTLTNAVGDSLEQAGTLNLTHDGEGALDKRGTLYVLAIGVDEYPGVARCGADRRQPCTLRYAGRDASAFAQTVTTALGPLHAGAPNVQVLSNAKGATPPTAANIRRALGALKNRATPTDTVVVFIAGHGVLDKAASDYLFMATDAKPDGPGWDGDSIVPWVNLENAVFGAKGRRFLFVDTCHAAGTYNGKLGNNAYHNDVVAFTATGQDQEALEFEALEHGVFTYAIMKGLGEGEADLDKSKVITVDKLGLYLKTKARELIATHGPSRPQPWPIPELLKARDAGNPVLARVK